MGTNCLQQKVCYNICYLIKLESIYKLNEIIISAIDQTKVVNSLVLANSPILSLSLVNKTKGITAKLS